VTCGETARPVTYRYKRTLLTLVPLLLTTIAALGVLLKRGPSCGHDFDFHLVSWMEVSRDWHTGLLYPHWLTSANFGAGEPRFVFYPPGSWMFGALLGTIAGWHVAPLLFTAICLLAGGFTMRLFARNWLAPAAATAAACLYVANPYTLFVAYERTAYGELMAASLMPLLLSFAVRPIPPLAWLSVTLAGIWLVNAPSGVIACYTLLWIAVLRLIVAPRLDPNAERSARAPLYIGIATAIGLALAGCYLLPAAYQQRWVDVVRAIGPNMRYQDSYLFQHTGESQHDAVLHAASVVACVLLAAALAGFFLWRPARQQRALLLLASLLPLILFLLLPISGPIWHDVPHLRYVQFTWRWLMVLAPVATLFVAGAIATRAPRIALIGGTALLCSLSVVTLTPRAHQYCDDQDNVSAQVQLMHDGDGQEGTDEYTPRESDNSEIAQDQPDVRILKSAHAEEPDSSKQENPEWQADPAAEIHATITTPEWNAEHRSIVIDTPISGFALIRLINYPPWEIRRNGRIVGQLPRREDGLLTVPVPQGRSEIDIRWRTTPDVWLGRSLSLLGILLWLAAWRLDRYTSRSATP
jgi:hypothetical protein